MSKPTHKIQLVRDGKGGEKDTRWQRLGSLWPTASGGLSGEIRLCAPLLIPSDGLRVVISVIEREDEPDAPGVDGEEMPR